VPGSERSQGDDCAVATPIAIAAFMVYAGGRTASTRRGEFAWNLLLLRFAYSARSGEGEVRCVETVSGSCLTYSFGKPLQISERLHNIVWRSEAIFSIMIRGRCGRLVLISPAIA
jgi:hypothetical protein